MAIIRLTAFSGEIPRTIPRLLPDTAAQKSVNVRLTNGGISPYRRSRFEHDFFNPNDNATIHLHQGNWMRWDGLVHAVPGPVAQDRLYVTGDGVPKMIVDGTTYPLVVDAPTARLTGTASGTANPDSDVVTRLYVYTLVTRFGEESQPSPISAEIDWRSGQTVTLSGFQAGTTSRGVVKQRIYRSQSGTGGTELFFIAERLASTASYVDSVPVEEIAEVIPSSHWNAPINSLSGLTSMPNGMMVAFSGKDLYFCEPYRPHAWPDIYSLTVDYPIVGIGAFGNSLLVTTTGNPYVVTGNHPDSMVMEKLEENLPCINPRGIVDLGYAVAYPSHEGLVLASRAGARLASETLFDSREWQHIRPDTYTAAQHESRYFASYRYINFRGSEVIGTFIIDLTGRQPYLMRTDITTQSFYYDLPSGKLFYLDSGRVMEWDAPGQSNAMMTYRSKPFYLPKPGNFGAILTDTTGSLSEEEQFAADQYREVSLTHNRRLIARGDPLGGAINGAAINQHSLNGDILLEVSAQSDVQVNIYADDVLRASLSRNDRMARLPSGFLARKWEVEVVGYRTVTQIVLASTGAELAGVE